MILELDSQRSFPYEKYASFDRVSGILSYSNKILSLESKEKQKHKAERKKAYIFVEIQVLHLIPFRA